MKKTISVAVLSILCLINILLVGSCEFSTAVFESKNHTVIIDAGHGLPDGGAVAPDGTIESDLNLEIAKLLRDKLTKNGITCIMIRNDQNSVYTKGDTIHEKKVSDIRNRVKIASDNPKFLVVSIHMNTYPSSEVCGAQVFYNSNSKNSKEIADEIQNNINIKFQPQNQKSTKPILSNIYFFNHIPNDSILIECGFLTNEHDLNNLKSSVFQDELSSAIAESVIFKLSGGE